MYSTFKFSKYLMSIIIMASLAVFNQEKYEGDKTIKLVRNDDEQKVEVVIDGEEFTTYLYSDALKKPVLYPIKTAKGTLVTRGFPLDPRPGDRVDHPHHVGLWFNYGDVNGLDFWNNSNAVPAEEKKHYGSIHHKEINNISSGNGKGELEVTMDWVDSRGVTLLQENTIFIFSGTNNMRMIDRITKLTALDEEVSMKDNKEGMLGIRVARELEHPPDDEPEVYSVNKNNSEATVEYEDITGRYRSSEGLEGGEVWGTRGRWMNLSGQINDEQISVTILDHRDNVGYPTYWHARGYGLFALNPLGQEALSDGENTLNFGLAAGESVTFKHRILVVSDTELSDKQINEYWDDFNSER